MSNIPLAIQLYSVRTDLEADFVGTLKQVKEMGYDYVEVAGLFGRTGNEYKQVLESVGLKAISAHVQYTDLVSDMDATIQTYADLGCEYIAIPALDDKSRPGAEGFEQVLENIRVIGPKCKAKGMTLLYHNHDFEFVKMPDGSFGLDYLYATISQDILETELDLCWVNVAGQSPVEYIKKYAGRCPVLHLKDFYFDCDKKDIFPILFAQYTGKPCEVKGKFEFRPVGYGMQVMPEIIEAGKEAGAKYFVVEQDFSVGRTALQAAKMSRDYLRPLGV